MATPAHKAGQAGSAATATASKFVWYELCTPHAKSAEAFYRSVIGWDAQDAGMPGMAYTLLSAGPVMVGGLYSPTADCAVDEKPGWIGSLGVADVDACAGQIQQAGGAVLRPPADIPGIGRFAVAADPYGAKFVLFHRTAEQPAPPPAEATPGRIGWHELHAGDGPGAFAFYSKLFGWSREEAMDMGPMGVYQIFGIDGKSAGGIMTRTPNIQTPFWLFYVNVEAIDAAVRRAQAGGGKLIMGPEQVPGGSWIAHCLDPQGVIFAMVAPTR